MTTGGSTRSTGDTESGTHMHRPGLEEMLYDAEAQAFDTLLIFRVDRLSRKVRELAQMVDELTKYGVTLKSITEPFDTANAAGKMMLQTLAVFAEFEHATIVERTKVGMEKKAKGGNFVGGSVPYGFTLNPEKGLIFHEEEALIVRKMFKTYALGKEGASAICKKINEAGHRNRNGRKWGRRVVLYMLKNPVYMGKIRWREVLYEGQHDPLVSEVLFEKANEVLQERHEDLKGRQWHNGDERLLTGIIKCTRCNSHMFGGGGYKKGVHVPYYVCSKRFNDHECDQRNLEARRERLQIPAIDRDRALWIKNPSPSSAGRSWRGVSGSFAQRSRLRRHRCRRASRHWPTASSSSPGSDWGERRSARRARPEFGPLALLPPLPSP